MQEIRDLCVSDCGPLSIPPAAGLVLALLNCGTNSGSRRALVLVEQAPGVWAKPSFLTTSPEMRAALEPALRHRVEVVTVSIAREAWRWRAGNGEVVFGDAFVNQIRTDTDRSMWVMAPVVRLAGWATTSQLAAPQDGWRDKVVVKGPGQTSGFEVRYVHVAKFLRTWLERGDEVHLIPKYSGRQGQPYVVFSNADGRSFLVILSPTRASANANLYTDISLWEEEDRLIYLEGLERAQKEKWARRRAIALYSGLTAREVYLLPYGAGDETMASRCMFPWRSDQTIIR